MPRIERFFGGTKVSNWTSGAFGAAGGVTTYGNGGEMNVYTDPADADQMYFAHKIKATGNFTVEEGDFDIDIVLIAGGGGGAKNPNPQPWGGGTSGGGAGGARVIDTIPVSSTGGPAGNGVYPIVIGAGGDGYDQAPSGNSNPGNDSTGFGYTSTGGGTGAPNSGVGPTGGSPVYWSVGVPGGSGGGGVRNVWSWSPVETMSAAGSGNAGGFSPSEGNPGGLGFGTYAPAAQSTGQGGGGGAGGAGNIGTGGLGPPGSPHPVFSYAKGGYGGQGLATTYFGGPTTPETYAGGGGGGQSQNWDSSTAFPLPVWGGGGAYPAGGGGTGGSATQPATPAPHGGQYPGDATVNPGSGYQGFGYGHDATVSTGGGGGGGSGITSGGGGGSGLLIIRYKV